MRVEDKLIIELCNTDNNRELMKSLLEDRDINMDYILRIIDKHMIKAFILEKLLNLNIPFKTKDNFHIQAKKCIIETTLHNKKIEKELRKVVRVLNEQNIEYVKIMPTYETVVKAPAESLKTMGDIGKWYEDNKAELQRKGIRHIAAYAHLGRYDMMFVYEADDEISALTTALSSLRGTAAPVPTETWTAVPMDEFARITRKFSD